MTTGSNRVPTTLESLHLMTRGNDVGVLKQLVDDALQDALEADAEGTKVYVLHEWSWLGWEVALTKKKRDMDSVIMGDLAQDI